MDPSGTVNTGDSCVQNQDLNLYSESRQQKKDLYREESLTSSLSPTIFFHESLSIDLFPGEVYEHISISPWSSMGWVNMEKDCCALENL